MGYLENGTEVAQKLYTQYGWSRNPIVAYLGNIQQESSIDPTNFQGADGDWSMGVGFNQWTPGTNLQERAQAIGRTDYLTIDCQLAVMDYERRAGIQYYATSSYNLSFDEFIKSTNDIEWLTYAWEANYERAGSPMMENRLRYAREWDARIDGILNLRNVVEEAVEWAIEIANDDPISFARKLYAEITADRRLSDASLSRRDYDLSCHIPSRARVFPYFIILRFAEWGEILQKKV